jgi:hypothetical protein
MGHAITGGGFFNIDVEPLKGVGNTGEVFAAAIKFMTVPLPVEHLSDELKLLVDELWDWQVCRVSDSKFTVVFPSRETRRMCTVSGKLYLPMTKSETSIREAFLSPKLSLVMPSTWVKMTGVQDDLMTKEHLRLRLSCWAGLLTWMSFHPQMVQRADSGALQVSLPGAYQGLDSGAREWGGFHCWVARGSSAKGWSGGVGRRAFVATTLD